MFRDRVFPLQGFQYLNFKAAFPTIRRLQRDLLSLAAKKVGKETAGIPGLRKSRPSRRIPGPTPPKHT